MDPAGLMCEIGGRAYARGLVAGTEGNFSCRLDDARLLCTPTGVCKGRLRPDDLCVVDLSGQPVSGVRPPSSEIRMHLAIYRAAATVRGVVHAHPPFATTLAVLGESVPPGLLPEGDVFFGEVPLAPYETPGTSALGDAVAPLVADHTAAILQNHGAVTWADDLGRAYELMEMLEAVCRVACHARALGPLRLIPPEKRAELAVIRGRLRGKCP